MAYSEVCIKFGLCIPFIKSDDVRINKQKAVCCFSNNDLYETAKADDPSFIDLTREQAEKVSIASKTDYCGFGQALDVGTGRLVIISTVGKDGL